MELVPNIPLANEHLTGSRTNTGSNDTLQVSDVMSLVRKFQPTGVRGIMDLPFTGVAGLPFMGIRVTPYILHPLDWKVLHDLGGKQANNVPAVLKPFRVYVPYLGPDGDPSWGTHDSFPFRITYYSAPPMLGRLALMYRYWNGQIRYHFQITSNAIVHGYLTAVVSKNVMQNAMIENPANIFDVTEALYIDNTSTADSYLRIDLSTQKNFEIAVPWERPYKWAEDFVLDVGKDKPKFSHPFVDTFVYLFAKGTISAAETAQLQIEVDIAFDGNFECLLPPLDNSLYLASYDYYKIWRNIAQNTDRNLVIPNEKTWEDSKGLYTGTGVWYGFQPD